jgi:hypothetical protein
MQTEKKLPVREDREAIALPAKRTDRVNGIITGCFFIAATVFAIIGLKLYDPILSSNDYLIRGAANSSQVILGAVFEMILVVSACGTAIMLYPYLKVYNKRLALGYLTFRVLEAVFISMGVISVLSLFTLSQSYTVNGNPDKDVYHTVGVIAKAFHDWTLIIGPKFVLGINTFIYSYVLYKTELVPRKLTVLGLTGAVLVFINSLLDMFGFITSFSLGDILLVLPIAIYEMILAGWLIAKGFNIQTSR